MVTLILINILLYLFGTLQSSITVGGLQSPPQGRQEGVTISILQI